MFFGRESLLERLGDLWRKPVSSLVTCRGRRRIGKSTLIAEFARRSHVRFIKLEGQQPDPNMTNDMQLAAFCRQLDEQTGNEGRPPATNWFEAFSRLDATLDNRTKTVVLLDEISWMGKYDPAFPAELKYAWDNRFSKHPRLVMVLCGSVSAWIDKYILKSKGFVGRPSLNLVVPELPLDECAKFWGRRIGQILPSEIADVLAITGGVPKYLENIDPARTADENIRSLCYRPGGLLVDEFNELFNDALDENLATKRKMIMSLVDGSRTGQEIADSVGLEYNGHVVATLGELETSGFIAKDNGFNPMTGKMSNLCRYRIADNYTRFYLKYVEPQRAMIDRDAFQFTTLAQFPGWSTIQGLQFECLVLNNLPLLMRHLRLDRTLLDAAAPFVYRKLNRADAGRRRGDGFQVDLLLKARRSLYVIEIKHRAEIGEEVVDEVQAKIEKMTARKKFSVFPVLVYCGRLSARVPADGFFTDLISIERLLGT